MRQENLFRPLDKRRAHISNLNGQIKVLRNTQQSMSREIEDFRTFVPKNAEQKLEELEVE